MTDKFEISNLKCDPEDVSTLMIYVKEEYGRRLFKLLSSNRKMMLFT